jgi:hypothetical protein
MMKSTTGAFPRLPALRSGGTSGKDGGAALSYAPGAGSAFCSCAAQYPAHAASASCALGGS